MGSSQKFELVLFIILVLLILSTLVSQQHGRHSVRS